MKVNELIKELKKHPKDAEVKDHAGDEIKGVESKVVSIGFGARKEIRIKS